MWVAVWVPSSGWERLIDCMGWGCVGLPSCLLAAAAGAHTGWCAALVCSVLPGTCPCLPCLCRLPRAPHPSAPSSLGTRHSLSAQHKSSTPSSLAHSPGPRPPSRPPFSVARVARLAVTSEALRIEYKV